MDFSSSHMASTTNPAESPYSMPETSVNAAETSPPNYTHSHYTLDDDGNPKLLVDAINVDDHASHDPLLSSDPLEHVHLLVIESDQPKDDGQLSNFEQTADNANTNPPEPLDSPKPSPKITLTDLKTMQRTRTVPLEVKTFFAHLIRKHPSPVNPTTTPPISDHVHSTSSSSTLQDTEENPFEIKEDKGQVSTNKRKRDNKSAAPILVREGEKLLVVSAPVSHTHRISFYYLLTPP